MLEHNPSSKEAGHAPPLSALAIIRGLWRLDPATMTKVSVLLYAFGFFAVNLHHTRFGPWSGGLLDAAYLAVGTLLVAFTLPFIVSGYLVARIINDGTGTEVPGLPGKAIDMVVLVMTTALSLILALMLFVFTSIHGNELHISIVYVVIYGLVMHMSISVSFMDQATHKPRFPQVAKFSPGAKVAIPFMSVGLFSQALLPEIQPAFGGGAGWRASFSHASPAPEPRSEVLLLRGEGGVVTYLDCREGEAIPMTTTLGEGVGYSTSGFWSVTEFTRRCRAGLLGEATVHPPNPPTGLPVGTGPDSSSTSRIPGPLHPLLENHPRSRKRRSPRVPPRSPGRTPRPTPNPHRSARNHKQGLLFISPINRDAREALEHYLRRNPRMGDVPRFPAPGPVRKQKGMSPGPEKPMRRETAAKWLVKAEGLAGLPKLVGGVFHPYRRLWATERKDLPLVDVAAAGGWKDTQALRLSYQHADAETVLRVVEGDRRGDATARTPGA